MKLLVSLLFAVVAVGVTSAQERYFFEVVEDQPKGWKPMCVVGNDVLISQFTVERPKDGSESPTLLVLRHRDGKKIEFWGNHLADYLMTRYDLLRDMPEG